MATGTTADLKRVTILVSGLDPDATESSSDETDHETQTNRPKSSVFEGFIRRTAAPENPSPSPVKQAPLTESMTSLVSDPGTGQLSRKSCPGVCKRKNGKWCARIKNPFNRRRIWLGTFNSEEAAAAAFASKNMKFESAKKRKEEQKKKRKILPLNIDDNVSPGTFGTAEEASEVSQNQESVDVQMSSDSLSSNWDIIGEEGDADMWMGKWVPMPDGREVIYSVKYGVPIIDNYGYLLGEFRKLDDDLWICNPEEEDAASCYV
ncbi:unnamed protein product [Cuscuta epithymum]|uniref:AP2/ERF domain-containing protein n=1 Tax=Cuscuta epithymum TaxID=186058 RepID=A0AAV0FW59_9ASTE|nr:unnamed protein product [Cuscuta epithymum]